MGGHNAKLASNAPTFELAQSTPFTKKQLRHLKKIIKKEYPNGLIDKNGFCKFFKQLQGRELSANFMHLLFGLSAVDNQSGVLNLHEFIRALSITASSNLDKKLEIMFKLLDVDDDGYLTAEKMRTLLGEIRTMLINEGRSDPHLHNAQIVESWVENMFEEFSTAGNGKLDIEQFQEACKANEYVVVALRLGQEEPRQSTTTPRSSLS